MTSRREEIRDLGPLRPGSGSTGVLADRIASSLVHHEPGWRLPRLSALARRYHASLAEVDAALDELAARHLLRRLPDGQVYRASPAEYRIPLEGISGLASQVDPMGGELACRDRTVSRRRPPEGVASSLGLGPGESALAVRCLWTVGGEPGALSVSYLPERGRPLADLRLGPGGPDGQVLGWPHGLESAVVTPGRAQAVQIELAPPPPSAARSLRLAPGEPAAAVTVRFDEPNGDSAVALTIVMLRPDLFRIVVQTPGSTSAGHTGSCGTAWTDLGGGWEP